MSDDLREKVKDQAKLVHLAGKISEFHEKNLKMYPFVFFEGVRSVKIDYDVSHTRVDNSPSEEPKTTDDYFKEISKALKATSNAFVSYDLELDEKANEINLDKRFKAIEDAVKTLFWNDIIVEVYFNGNIRYKTKKR